MKVQVKDEQGIDEAGNKHPAPGIDDGTHECEMKDQWQNPYTPDKRWEDEPDEANHQHSLSHGYATRQAWRVLAEQEKEVEPTAYNYKSDYWKGFENALLIMEELGYCDSSLHPYNIRDCVLSKVNRLVGKNPRKTDQKKLQRCLDDSALVKSTRIAELEARVAELEGVLNDVQKGIEPLLEYSMINKEIEQSTLLTILKVLATNALKKNTDGK